MYALFSCLHFYPNHYDESFSPLHEYPARKYKSFKAVRSMLNMLVDNDFTEKFLSDNFNILCHVMF